MTDEEALTLKPGDIVETIVGAHAGTPARMVHLPVLRVREHRYPGGLFATVLVVWPKRKVGYLERTADQIKFARRSDPVTPHIYADWLEEHGELRAAQLLREAFPLA